MAKSAKHLHQVLCDAEHGMTGESSLRIREKNCSKVGQFPILNNSEMDKNIKELLGPHKNSGYLGSCGYGFMGISLSNFELEWLENQEKSIFQY